MGASPWGFESLRPHLDSVGYSSAVHRLRKPLPDLETMCLSRDLSARQKMTLMNRAIARESGQVREMLALSRLVLVRYFYGRRAAAKELRRWRARVELTDALELAVELTRPFIEAGDHDSEAAHHAVRWPALRRASWRTPAAP